jgi:hypothetical protein
MSKVKIRNIIDRAVILSDSNIRFRREIRPNQVITMDSEKLDEAMSSIGVMNLFKRGFLRIEGEEEVKAELEIFEDLGIDMEQNSHFLSKEELIKLMSTGTDFALKQAIENDPESRYPVIVAAALEADGLTMGKIDIIKKITGRDIIKLRSQKQEFEK